MALNVIHPIGRKSQTALMIHIYDIRHQTIPLNRYMEYCRLTSLVPSKQKLWYFIQRCVFDAYIC